MITPRQFGPTDSQAAFSGKRPETIFALLALAADFLEASRDDDEMACSMVGRLHYRLFDMGGGNSQNHQVHMIVDGRDAGDATITQDALGLGIDRINHPGIAAVDEVMSQGMPDRAGGA